jgi:hypothetical protein
MKLPNVSGERTLFPLINNLRVKPWRENSGKTEKKRKRRRSDSISSFLLFE